MRPARAVAIALLAGPAALAGQEADTTSPGDRLRVRTDTLANGMRVLAVRRPGGPTASFVLRFDVGAADDPAGRSGAAHLVEHLLFKGTTTIGTRGLAEERALFRAMDAAQDSLLMGRPGGLEEVVAARLRERIETLEDSARTYAVSNEFTEILAQHGARNLNATTDHEATTYYVSLPANRAELWFVLEADRMLNPVFRDFYTERDVVLEEHRTRVAGSPGGRLAAAFYAAAYPEHPYGRPVLGEPSELRTLTRDDVVAFHGRHYRSDNAVVAVVGAIDPDRVLALARHWFGAIPVEPDTGRLGVADTMAAGAMEAGPAEPGRGAPPGAGERRVRVEYDALPQLMMGWRVPGGLHDDAPALSVLTGVLGGGTAGRLHRRLVVEEQMTAAVSVSLAPAFGGPRQLLVSTQPLEGTTVAELEAAIRDEVEGLREAPPTAAELARARTATEVAAVRQLTTNLGLAIRLAESMTQYGDWRAALRMGARTGAVTAADVARVAEAYLTPGRRTVAVLAAPSPNEEEEPAR